MFQLSLFSKYCQSIFRPYSTGMCLIFFKTKNISSVFDIFGQVELIIDKQTKILEICTGIKLSVLHKHGALVNLARGVHGDPPA